MFLSAVKVRQSHALEYDTASYNLHFYFEEHFLITVMLQMVGIYPKKKCISLKCTG